MIPLDRQTSFAETRKTFAFFCIPKFEPTNACLEHF